MVAVPEQGQGQRPDNAPYHADQERAHGTGGFPTGHQGLGQESNEDAETDPDQDQVDPLLGGRREIELRHQHEKISLDC